MMNQAIRRPLRPWHLLLLFAMWLASAPAAAQALPSAQALAASSFQVQFLAPPVAGQSARFSVTALGSDGKPIEAFLGIVTVTASGPGSEVKPSLYTYVLLNKGVAWFDVLWTQSGRQLLTVSETLGPTHEEAVNVLPGEPSRFELELSATLVKAGTPISATVTVYDTNNNIVSHEGDIKFESTDLKAVLPASPRFELTDRGVKTFNITFMTVSAPSHQLSVLDNRPQPSTLITPGIKSIQVTPGAIASLELIPRISNNTITAGMEFGIDVLAKDAAGNTFPYPAGESLQFSSTDGQAEVPPVVYGPGPHYVELRTAAPQTITVVGVNSVRGQVTIRVLPSSFYQVVMATTAAQPVDACTPATVQLRSVDSFGNSVPDAKDVQLCGTPNDFLSYTNVGTTLANARIDGQGCIRGYLSSIGTGQVSWINTKPAPITFIVEPSNRDELGITWQPGSFSPENSILSFPGTTENPPRLRTFTGELLVQFDLRNACGEPVEPPADKTFSFKGQSPLAVTALTELNQVGRRSAAVRLPRCPDTAGPLMLGPAFNGDVIKLRSGEQLTKEVLPNCLPPDVQLEVKTRPRDAKATPGARVEFEVTVSNTGTATIPAGYLHLETVAVSERQASVDEGLFAAVDNKVSLPALEPGAIRTVKLQGQAAVQMDQPVSLTTWYTTQQGAALTEQKSLSLEWGKLEVDVGNGCQTVPLPSQFLPWLALLAAASRSRSRLRRLTRGERNDR
jgi:hypothetical protein